MTAPIQRLPGLGDEISQGLSPLVEALQRRQQEAQQQARFNQQLAAQQEAQRRSQMFAALGQIQQQEGAEGLEITQQLESELGLEGMTAQIASARKGARTRSQREFENFLTESGFDEQTANALRVDSALASRGATAEMRNSLFAQLAPERPESLSALDQARLIQLQLGNEKLRRELGRLDAEAITPDQAQRIAEGLGVPYLPDLPPQVYAEIADNVLTQDEADPRALILNIASQMAAQTNFLGRPVRTTAEALDLARNIAQPIFPSAETIQITPQLEAQTQALQRGPQALRAIEDEVRSDRSIRRSEREAEIRRRLIQMLANSNLGPFVMSDLEQLADRIIKRGPAEAE